jgi:DNA processing protein
LAQAGVAIVSGLALGIDGAAHRGALKVGGQTIAVLGTGLNKIYPLEHRDLAEQITQTGTLFSQFEPNFTGYKGGRNYLLRNHLISGLSQVLVVIEAQERSGSIAALRAAIAQERPIGLSRLLVESQSWASDLVESGQAFLVTSADDVLKRVL